MILFLNEWSKQHRYADRFDSFNKFLNKLLENDVYRYVDLVEIGLEYSYNGKQNKYIDGSGIRFHILEKLFKDTVPEIIQSGHVPIIEFKPLIDILDGLRSEESFFISMLLNTYSKVGVFCGSQYEYEHFSNTFQVAFPDTEQLLYDGETTFFADVSAKLEELQKNYFAEEAISSIDGYGYFLKTTSDASKIEYLTGNIGSKISYEEFLQWIVEHRDSIVQSLVSNGTDDLKARELSSIVESVMKDKLLFVRRRHPVEIILNQI